MAKTRTLSLVFYLVAGAAGLALQHLAYAASCDAILGNWTWFTGGVATINPDGTAVYANPDGTIVNDGTWECTEASQGIFILKWRIGGYVNSLALSADGRGLSSTDPSQSFVTAKRIGTPTLPRSSSPGAVSNAKAYLDKAYAYSGKKMWDEAILEYTKAIEINPKSAEAYNGRGAVYGRNGQYDRAIDDFTKAIGINPKDAVAYGNRGATYYMTGQYDKAVADYSKDIEINPKFAGMSRRNRADAYYKKGEYARALDDLNKAQALGAKVDAKLLDELRRATPASEQPSRKVTPEDSQEIARLVERISRNYRDSKYFGSLLSEYAAIGHSVVFEEGFVLAFRYMQCNNIVSFDRDTKDYTSFVDLAKDCDRKRHGLKWKEKVMRFRLARANSPSITLLETGNDNRSNGDIQISNIVETAKEGEGTQSGTHQWSNRIGCGDHKTCEQISADLNELVEIVGRYSSPTTSSLEPEPKTTEEPRHAQSNDSQEISGLVERLNENYRRDKPEFHWPDGSIFDDAHIRKGHAVALEKDFTLVERYLECSMPEPNWRFGDNARIPADYRMSDDSVADCDKNRHGLKWEEKTVRRPLAEIDPSSIGLPKTGKADSGSDLRLTFGYEDDKFATGSISCKNRGACEQVGSELKRLIEIAQKSAAPKTTASLEPNTKNAEEPRHAQGGDAQEVASLATAKVDPALVGMWKLAHPGLDMYWQIRAGGAYRYFGVNARPFEHWGTIEASGGRWATQWAGGQDGGSYTLSGNTWQETGKAGTGNWQRIWKPGDGGSQVLCPLIDVAEVEALFGNATRGRAGATNCDLTASGVGYADSLAISVIDNASERFVNVRRDTSKMRPVIDVPGLGDAAFIDADSLHVLKGIGMP